MIKNKDSLKAKIKNISTDKNIPSSYLLQNFMFESLLKRISKSKYKEKFVIKGGLLISSIFGVDLRSTMDMDATIVGLPLDKENIEKILNEIISINVDDNINLSLVNIKDIRQEEIYSGFNVNILATFDGIRVNLMIDITTGDVITYNAILYDYKTLFDNSIKLFSYNYETILAEKFEAIISRNIDNTRMKDYYDVYMFIKLKWDEIDKNILRDAIKNTSIRRKTENLIENASEYISLIEEDDGLIKNWLEYQRKYDYAKDISFEDTIKAIKLINEVLTIVHS